MGHALLACLALIVVSALAIFASDGDGVAATVGGITLDAPLLEIDVNGTDWTKHKIANGRLVFEVPPRWKESHDRPEGEKMFVAPDGDAALLVAIVERAEGVPRGAQTDYAAMNGMEDELKKLGVEFGSGYACSLYGERASCRQTTYEKDRRTYHGVLSTIQVDRFHVFVHAEAVDYEKGDIRELMVALLSRGRVLRVLSP